MSIIKESMKKQKNNILSTDLKQELSLLPKIIKDKKIEKEILSKEILTLKEKIKKTKKELEKISVNIMNLEKEYTSFILKKDKSKMDQKISLNLIYNEISSNSEYNDIILFQKNKKDEFKELFSIFFNFENDYNNQMDILYKNNIDITKLLIGAYIHIKTIKNDIPIKYKEIKKRILNIINKIKDINLEKIYEYIIHYIENVFIILDNNDKNNMYNKKIENLEKTKNEIFLKLKLIEEEKIDKEKKINLITNFINELIILLEKNNFFLNLNNVKNKNLNNLNLSNNKETLNNEYRKTNDKISLINIDLTSTSSLEKKNYNINNNKKTIDSFDFEHTTLNDNSLNKKISLSKYKTINELEKEIYEHYIEIKKNPLFKNKKKLLKKKINNIKNTDNSNSINNNKKMLLSSNKSQEKEKEKTKEIKAKISKNNTTMTLNINNSNAVISNINNLINKKEINNSYDLTMKKEKKKEKLFTKEDKINNNKRKIQINLLDNSSEIKEKDKINQSLNENKNIIKNKNNKKYMNIKHNKTNLLKKKSLNKIEINPSNKEIKKGPNIKISKNSLDKQKSTDLLNILNNNKGIADKNKRTITEQNKIKIKNKSPKINSNLYFSEYKKDLLNNNYHKVNHNNSNNINNSLYTNNINKNCHIIPFKKGRIHYIKDKNYPNKINKNGIRLNYNNYSIDKDEKSEKKNKNFVNNSQIIKCLPKSEINGYSFHKQYSKKIYIKA